MKKIVHVIGALIAGGAESFVVNLAIALSSKAALTIVVLSNRTDAVSILWKENVIKYGVNIVIGPQEKVGLLSILWYRKVIKEIEPDIVHLHTPNTELMHFLSWYKCPVFRTIHNTHIKFNLLLYWAIKNNHALQSIACGEAVMDSPKNNIFPNKVLISNGVEFSWPTSQPSFKKAARNKLGLALDVTHYISVGRMSATTLGELQKAQDVTIAAWQIFERKKNKGKAILHLIGDGNLASDLKNEAKPSDTIFFHGVQSNISDWLLAADWFVMPSRFEGLPIAGIEAIGTGTGCIFSDIEPLVQLNPPLVYWVSVNNPQSLVDALLKSYNNNEFIVNEEAVLSFRKEYSIDLVSQKYLELYSKCFDGIFL
jgi:glycosyltransferase involved in cell wall biosynthesis